MTAARSRPVKELTTKSLKCHSLGHAWDPVAAILEGRGRVRLELRCMRCRTERTDLIVRSRGELEHRRYTYTPGYLVEDVQSYGSRGQLNGTIRSELIGRIMQNGKR